VANFSRMPQRKALVLDFDGVLHSYTSPYKGPWDVPDEPVEGAFDFLRRAREHFTLYVFSSRSAHASGIRAMKQWFIAHGWPADGEGEPQDLHFPSSKPPAFLSIDDRAVTFTGEWPGIEELLAFKPWNKK